MMSEIVLFLKALDKRLVNHVGVFVPKYTQLPTKFPAYQKYNLQVWLVNGDIRDIISNVDITARTVEEDEKTKVREELIISTIENILKYYGI